MNIWRELQRGFWVVQCDLDHADVRPGDSIEIQRKDGTLERRVVRRIVHRGSERIGPRVTCCPDGTPEVRRPLAEAK